MNYNFHWILVYITRNQEGYSFFFLFVTKVIRIKTLCWELRSFVDGPFRHFLLLTYVKFKNSIELVKFDKLANLSNLQFFIRFLILLLFSTFALIFIFVFAFLSLLFLLFSVFHVLFCLDFICYFFCILFIYSFVYFFLFLFFFKQNNKLNWAVQKIRIIVLHMVVVVYNITLLVSRLSIKQKKSTYTQRTKHLLHGFYYRCYISVCG